MKRALSPATIVRDIKASLPERLHGPAAIATLRMIEPPRDQVGHIQRTNAGSCRQFNDARIPPCRLAAWSPADGQRRSEARR